MFSSAWGGVLGGALVLLVVIALSWISTNGAISHEKERTVWRFTVEDSKPAKDEGFEKEGEEESEAQEPLSDWEAAHAAAESGDLPKLRFLIQNRGVHVDAEDDYAMTLLQVASRHGHLEIVNFLVDNGAAINAVEVDTRAALHFAAIQGRLSVARCLLERGADVHIRKRLGLTPLHVVAQTSHTDLLKLLLEHGAKLEAPDDRGNTPLDWAISFVSGVMVQALLEQGAFLRKRDADGKTPMERAVRGWDLLKIDVLAKKGQSLPRNKGDMQRVLMLYAMSKSQATDEETESPNGT